MILSRVMRGAYPVLRDLAADWLREALDAVHENVGEAPAPSEELTVYLWRDSSGWGAQVEGGGSLEPGATAWLAVAEAIRRRGG